MDSTDLLERKQILSDLALAEEMIEPITSEFDQEMGFSLSFQKSFLQSRTSRESSKISTSSSSESSVSMITTH